MSKGWKITFIVFLSLIFVLCAAIDIWYLVILKEKDNHILSYTFEVGKQTLADGSSSKYFVEVEYNSNEDGSGLEEFGIKFNYMLDENQTAFFSQALQYVASEGNSIVFKTRRNTHTTQYAERKFLWHCDYVKRVYEALTFEDEGITRYNYMSDDDYKTPKLSTNPINANTGFKIQIGDELFIMKFKGEVARTENPEYKQYNAFYSTKTTEYDDYNVEYFAASLFNTVKKMKNGTNSVHAFEFGDLFDYFELNPETGKYDREVDPDKFKALTMDVKSYYSIFIHKSSQGVKNAGDSMFNAVSGNSGYTTGETSNTQGYFIGRSIVDVTLDNFIRVKIDENNVALKLKSSFMENFEKYSERIKLDILIDLDKLGKLNFVGFTKDSGLNKFNILQCRVKKTTGDNVSYEVVAYE